MPPAPPPVPTIQASGQTSSPNPPALSSRQPDRSAILKMTALSVTLICAFFALSVWHAEAAHFIARFSPGCLFRKLTGLACPGCGGTRAAISLLQGNFSEVVRYNFLWIPTALILAFEFACGWINAFCPPPKPPYLKSSWRFWRTRLIIAYTGFVLAFAILRNLFDF